MGSKEPISSEDQLHLVEAIASERSGDRENNVDAPCCASLIGELCRGNSHREMSGAARKDWDTSKLKALESIDALIQRSDDPDKCKALQLAQKLILGVQSADELLAPEQGHVEQKERTHEVEPATTCEHQGDLILSSPEKPIASARAPSEQSTQYKLDEG